MPKNLHCLITGVTGWIGGRLVPHLLKNGYKVQFSQNILKLQERSRIDKIEATES